MARLTTVKKKQVYFPNDEDGAWVEIKYIKPGIRAKIDSLTQDVSMSGKDGESFTTIKFNREKKRSMILAELVSGLGGWFDAKDKEITVPSVRNLDLLCDEFGNFYDWLNEESDTFIKEIEDEAEAERKNL